MAIALDADLGSSSVSTTLTTSAAAAAGSRVIVFVAYADPVETCTGATGGGLTWVVDKQVLTAAQNGLVILSADAPSGLASSTVITPTFSGTGADFVNTIAAASFTGLATGASGYVDTTAVAVDDFEEVWATNNFVTTNADDLLVCISSSIGSAGSNTPTAPASEIHDVAGDGKNATEYRIVSATGTYTLAGTWSIAVAQQINIGVAYKAGVATPVPTWGGHIRRGLASVA